MDIKYIINLIEFNKICECNIETGIFIEKKRESNYKVTKGVYSNIEDSTIKMAGIIADKDGPLIFFDDKIFRLNNYNFKFKHKNVGNLMGQFSLHIDGKEVIDITYRKPYSEYDTWSKEEEVDFFQWLLEFSFDDNSKKRFIKMYTI